MNTMQIIDTWQEYLEGIDDWRDLIKNSVPKETGCGLIYALANPLDRPGESFAIADMQQIQSTEPHYHRIQTEIYFVLQGKGVVVLGECEHSVEKGSVIVITPNVVHTTFPQENLVLAVVNTPPFIAEDSILLTE